MNLFLLTLPLLAAHPAIEQRIVLRPDMLIDETAIGQAPFLVDEQANVGDPASGHGIAPTKPYFPGWTAWRYPVSVSINLGAKYHITRLYFYVPSGNTEVTISTGLPFAWKPKTSMIPGFNEWLPIQVDADTRWLRLTLPHAETVTEIVAYGTPLEAVKPVVHKAVKPRREPPTVDQMIGANGFIDDPIDKLTPPMGYLREYHNWGWDREGKDGKLRFGPSAAGGGWNFDDFYAKLKANGVTVCPAIEGNIPSLFGTKGNDAKPIKEGADPEDPASYAIHSGDLFQWAARYGRRKVEDSVLDLAPDQPRKTGLNLLNYLENWNEPDKTWVGRPERFDPFDLAAMCSADYDGNEGKMGNGHGVKTADPSMKLVLSGLSNPDPLYFTAMKFWSDWNRKGSFPVDVLNVHHYSNSGEGEQWVWGGHGISPEEDHLRRKMQDLVDWRDANVPDREFWLTEFGYDTNPASPLHCGSIGAMNDETVQAAWLVRSYLALAAARVDRAAMFMFRDTNTNGKGVFETSGLATEKGQWRLKPSWYFVSTLRKALWGTRFESEVPSGHSDVMIYRFKGHGRTAYAVWCPTKVDKHIQGYSLKIGGSSAKQISFKDGSGEGTSETLSESNGAVSVNVSEIPVIVITG